MHNLLNYLELSGSANLTLLDGSEITIIKYNSKDDQDFNKRIIIRDNGYFLSDLSNNNKRHSINILTPDHKILEFDTNNPKSVDINHLDEVDPETIDLEIKAIKDDRKDDIFTIEPVISVTSFTLESNETGTHFIIKDHKTRSKQTSYNIPITPDAESINKFKFLFFTELEVIYSAFYKSNGYDILAFIDEIDLSYLFTEISEFNEILESISENQLSPDYSIGFEQTFEEINSLFDKELEIKTGLDEIQKIEYLNKGNLSVITAKEIRTPFIKTFSEKNLKKDSFTFNVNVEEKANGAPIKIPVTLTLKQNLRYYQLLIISAYFSLRQKNPDAPGVPLLDIINMIHKVSNDKRRIQAKSKLYDQAYKEIEDLIGVTFTFDRSPVIEYRAKQGNKEATRYLANGGKGKVTDTFISASIGTVRLPNGKIVDALIPKTGFLKDDFYNYILEVNQIKAIPEEIAITPLNAGLQNDEVFNYIALKVANLPYYDDINFLDKKIMILKALEQEKQELEEDLNKEIEELQTDIKKTRQSIKATTDTFKTKESKSLRSKLEKQKTKLKEYEKELENIPDTILERERELSAPYKKMQQELLKDPEHKYDLRISLDKLIEELKIKNARRTRIAGQIEKILDDWIKDKILVKYKKIEKRVRGEMTPKSYEIYFF